MDQQTPPMQMPTEHHARHNGIFILLIIAIVLMLGIFGLIGYQLFLTPTPEQPDLITTEQPTEEPPPLVEEPLTTPTPVIAPELATFLFSGSRHEPSFFYPEGWHVFSSSLIDESPGALNTIFIDPEPLRYMLGDGPIPSVVIHTVDTKLVDLSGYTTYTELIQSYYNDENFYTNITSTTTEKLDGTVTNIKGHALDGLYQEHDFEVVIYETPSRAVLVNYSHLLGPDEQEGWEAIRNSLEFSVIN